MQKSGLTKEDSVVLHRCTCRFLIRIQLRCRPISWEKVYFRMSHNPEVRLGTNFGKAY